MMVAWAGMAAGGYVGGVLFDLSLSYTLSFAEVEVSKTNWPNGHKRALGFGMGPGRFSRYDP